MYRYWQTHTHTHTLILIHTHTGLHTLSPRYAHTLTQTHTHRHRLMHIRSLSYIETYTKTHTHLAPAQCSSLKNSTSPTHSVLQTLIRSLTNTYSTSTEHWTWSGGRQRTHTNKHTHTHSHTLTLLYNVKYILVHKRQSEIGCRYGSFLRVFIRICIPKIQRACVRCFDKLEPRTKFIHVISKWLCSAVQFTETEWSSRYDEDSRCHRSDHPFALSWEKNIQISRILPNGGDKCTSHFLDQVWGWSVSYLKLSHFHIQTTKIEADHGQSGQRFRPTCPEEQLQNSTYAHTLRANQYKIGSLLLFVVLFFNVDVISQVQGVSDHHPVTSPFVSNHWKIKLWPQHPPKRRPQRGLWITWRGTTTSTTRSCSCGMVYLNSCKSIQSKSKKGI